MEGRIKYKKKFYRIREVASLLSVRTSVVRYWEKEFQIDIHKTPGGQRYYSVHDLKLLMKIKYLLYKEKYTIEGAKGKLHSRQLRLPVEEMIMKDTLRYVRKEVEKIIRDEQN